VSMMVENSSVPGRPSSDNRRGRVLHLRAFHGPQMGLVAAFACHTQAKDLFLFAQR
jgi:hypothetical protein